MTSSARTPRAHSSTASSESLNHSVASRPRASASTSASSSFASASAVLCGGPKDRAAGGGEAAHRVDSDEATRLNQNSNSHEEDGDDSHQAHSINETKAIVHGNDKPRYDVAKRPSPCVSHGTTRDRRHATPTSVAAGVSRMTQPRKVPLPRDADGHLVGAQHHPPPVASTPSAQAAAPVRSPQSTTTTPRTVRATRVVGGAAAAAAAARASIRPAHAGGKAVAVCAAFSALTQTKATTASAPQQEIHSACTVDAETMTAPPPPATMISHGADGGQSTTTALQAMLQQALILNRELVQELHETRQAWRQHEPSRQEPIEEHPQQAKGGAQDRGSHASARRTESRPSRRYAALEAVHEPHTLASTVSLPRSPTKQVPLSTMRCVGCGAPIGSAHRAHGTDVWAGEAHRYGGGAHSPRAARQMHCGNYSVYNTYPNIRRSRGGNVSNRTSTNDDVAEEEEDSYARGGRGYRRVKLGWSSSRKVHGNRTAREGRDNRAPRLSAGRVGDATAPGVGVLRCRSASTAFAATGSRGTPQRCPASITVLPHDRHVASVAPAEDVNGHNTNRRNRNALVVVSARRGGAAVHARPGKHERVSAPVVAAAHAHKEKEVASARQRYIAYSQHVLDKLESMLLELS